MGRSDEDWKTMGTTGNSGLRTRLREEGNVDGRMEKGGRERRREMRNEKKQRTITLL